MYEANGLYLAACRFIQSILFYHTQTSTHSYRLSLDMEMNLKSICNECTRFLFVDLNLERLNSIELKLKSIETIYHFGRENGKMWREYGKWENMKAYGQNMNWKWKKIEKNWNEPKRVRIWNENGQNINRKGRENRTENSGVSTVKYDFFSWFFFISKYIFSIFSLFEGQIDFAQRIITRTLAREHKEITEIMLAGLLWERIIFIRSSKRALFLFWAVKVFFSFWEKKWAIWFDISSPN